MQYSTAGGPLIAVVALVVILLLCRWTFGTGGRYQRPAPPARPGAPADYGLLVPVATTRTPADAALLRDVLRDAGIRGTVAPGKAPGRSVVLVFAADADRARSLVASQPER